MPAIVWSLLDAFRQGTSHLCLRDQSVSLPGASNAVTGWTQGTTVAARFSAMAAGGRQAAGTFGTTALPAAGSVGTSDCGVTEELYSGTFEPGTWNLKKAFDAVATMSGSGHLLARVFISSDPTGQTLLTEITTSPIAYSTLSNLTTGSNANTSGTWSAPGFSVLSQAIIFKFAWEVDTASGSSTAAIVFRQDSANSIIQSANFIPDPVQFIGTDNAGFGGTSGNIAEQVLTRVGDLITVKVVYIRKVGAVVSSVVDTAGNTYTKAASVVVSGGSLSFGNPGTVDIWYSVASVQSLPGANAITINFSGADGTNVGDLISNYYRAAWPANPLLLTQGAADNGTPTTANSGNFDAVLSKGVADFVSYNDASTTGMIAPAVTDFNPTDLKSTSGHLMLPGPTATSLASSNTSPGGFAALTAVFALPAVTMVRQQLTLPSRLGPITFGPNRLFRGSVSGSVGVGVAKSLAASVGGAASLSDALSIARAQSAAITGHAAVADSVAVARALSDAIAGHGAVADALSVARKLSDSIAGGAEVADAMGLARSLVDSVSGHASLIDALGVARALTDAVSGHASVADAMGVSRALSGSIAGHASVTDAVGVLRALSLAAAGHASGTFALFGGGAKAFAVAVQAAAVVADALSAARALAMGASGHAAVSDAMGVRRALAAAASGAGSVADALGVGRALSAPLAGHAAVADALSRGRPLAASVAGAASMLAALVRLKALSASVTARASVAGSIVVGRALSSAAHGSSSVTISPAVARSLSAAIAGASRVVASAFAASLTAPMQILIDRANGYGLLTLQPGGAHRFSATVTVLGVLTDVTGMVLTIHPPAGSPLSPIVDAAPVRDAQGAYHSDQLLSLAATPGVWVERWSRSGSSTDDNALTELRFVVQPLGF